MEQISILDLTHEPKQKLRHFLLTAVLQIDGGLACGGYEWHEKYVAKLPGYNVDKQQLLEAFMACNKDFKRGVIINRGKGPEIKIGDVYAWFAMIEIRPTTAKEIIEQNILPVFNLVKIIEPALLDKETV